MKDMMIGVDLAKRVFQLHGATKTGEVKFRKKLSREQFRAFMAAQPTALVVLEACGSASYWAREVEALGHEVRLIAPQYVRPFVKAPEKRCGRCGSNRDRGTPARDAVCGAEDDRSAGEGNTFPGT